MRCTAGVSQIPEPLKPHLRTALADAQSALDRRVGIFAFDHGQAVENSALAGPVDVPKPAETQGHQRSTKSPSQAAAARAALYPAKARLSSPGNIPAKMLRCQAPLGAAAVGEYAPGKARFRPHAAWHAFGRHARSFPLTRKRARFFIFVRRASHAIAFLHLATRIAISPKCPVQTAKPGWFQECLANNRRRAGLR